MADRLHVKEECDTGDIKEEYEEEPDPLMIKEGNNKI